MHPSSVMRAASLEEAVEVLAERGPSAGVVAGGTDLAVRRRRGLPVPEVWVDISSISGPARDIVRSQDRVVIGALATFRAIAASDLVRRTLPALYQAANIMGSVQIRNRATLGGNIGNASPAGDSLPPLIAGDATAHLLSSRGRRDIPVEDLFTGPGQTCLAPDELVEAVSYPVLEGAWSGFRRVATRASHDISKMSAALRATLEQGRLAAVRVALGAVAPVPLRVPDVEAMIDGRVFNGALLDAVGLAASRAARAITDVRSTAGYRADMCGEVVVELLESFIRDRRDPSGRAGLQQRRA